MLLPVEHLTATVSSPASQKTLLTPDDFTLLGFYPQSIGPSLAHRYVGSELRFMRRGIGSLMAEYRAIVPFGSVMPGKLLSGDNSGYQIPFWANWWDEPKQRLWSTTSGDYTANFIQTQIFTRTLDANGVLANRRGPWGLQGVDMKCVYGGVCAVPKWFQAAYQFPPYLVGFGGYTSLLNQGGGASLGLTAYAIPDPEVYPDGTIIPVTDFKVCADHRKGDRGKRVTIPINYFDGGDPRPNPTTPPTVPPINGSWMSPAADGLGWWVWGDSYYGAVVWIDTPTKHGIVCVASLGGGKCWYMNSTLHYDKRQYEWHIYDPAHLAEAAAGLRPVSHVQPVHMRELVIPGFGNIGLAGNGYNGNVGAMTYDDRTGRLYLNPSDMTNTAAVTGRLLTYQVAV